MKAKYSILTFLFFFGASNLFGQQSIQNEIDKIHKWKVTQYGFGTGVNYDTYQNMSYSQIMSFAANPSELSHDLTNFTEESNTSTGGAFLYSSVSLSPLANGGLDYRDDRELQIGVAIYGSKEAMVSYKNAMLDTSIVFCNIGSELAMDGAYLFKGSLGKRINWHIGCGMSLGASFNEDMILMKGKYFEPGTHPSSQESLITNRETFAARNVFYSRAYVPYGVHFGKGDWLFGFNSRTGLGMQKVRGSSTNFIRKTGSFLLSVKYRFE